MIPTLPTGSLASFSFVHVMQYPCTINNPIYLELNGIAVKIIKMLRKTFKTTLLLLLLSNVNAQQIFNPSVSGDGAIKGIEQSLQNLPTSFIKNMGQWDYLTKPGEPQILYQGDAPGWNAHVWFMKDRLSYGFAREQENEIGEEGSQYLVWNMYFEGCNPNVMVTAADESNTHINYMKGADFSRHASNVPGFKQLKYNNVYNNIDITYCQTGSKLKSDYIIRPGGDISAIKNRCEGIRTLKINKSGQLEIITSWGVLVEVIPESYQIINGSKKNIHIEYHLINNTTWGYKVNGHYDKNANLVIDPIALDWCTWVGGTLSTGNGYVFDHTRDAQGNVYGTGFYNSSFPTTAGVYSTNNSNTVSDVIVFKLNNIGTTLIYATYVGTTTGNGQSEGRAIDINTAGEAYVTGLTMSGDFPLVSPLPGPPPLPSGGVVLFKLNNSGTTLLYSTYIGYGEPYDLDLNNVTGEMAITGFTTISQYPTTANAFDGTFNPGFMVRDAFVTLIAANGLSLTYSTFIGGNSNDVGIGIRVDDLTGYVYVTGSTNSSDFPVTANAFDNTFNAPNNWSDDAFLIAINPALSGAASLTYSTFIGGSGGACPATCPYDYGQAIALDPNGYVTVVGYTSSPVFPVTLNAYQSVLKGKNDIFVAKMDLTQSDAASLKYCTLLGGTATEVSSWMRQKSADIVTNKQGDVFIVSPSSSYDFPVVCELQGAYPRNPPTLTLYDVVVSVLNPTLSALNYSTYLGGDNNDYFPTISIIDNICTEEVMVAATSHSLVLPTTAGVLQPTKSNGGNDNPFIFTLKPVIYPDFIHSSAVCNTPIVFTDQSNAACIWQSAAWAASDWRWDFGDGTTSTLQNPTHTYSAPGNYQVKLVVSCPKDSIVKTITVADNNCNNQTGCPVCLQNGSFETGTFCETDKVNAAGWATCGLTPDDQPCAATLGWGTGYPSNLPADDGNWYVGMASIPYASIYEGVTQQLCKPLEIGKKYNISAAIAYSTDGPYTQEADLEVWCGSSACSESTLLWSVHAGSKSWQKVSGSFTATTACQYLTFRNNCKGFFCTNSFGQSYLMLDNIKITEDGPCNCVNPPVLTLNNTINETCGKSNGTVSISVNTTTGTPPYTYSWNTVPVQTAATATGLKAGTYQLIVTDNAGCKDTLTGTISNLDIAAGFAKGTATCNNCGCKEWVLVNAINGTPPYTYQWPDGYDKRYKNKLCSGNYTVKVTDKNGCSVDVNITAP